MSNEMFLWLCVLAAFLLSLPFVSYFCARAAAMGWYRTKLDYMKHICRLDIDSEEESK